MYLAKDYRCLTFLDWWFNECQMHVSLLPSSSHFHIINFIDFEAINNYN